MHLWNKNIKLLNYISIVFYQNNVVRISFPKSEDKYPVVFGPHCTQYQYNFISNKIDHFVEKKLFLILNDTCYEKVTNILSQCLQTCVPVV